MAQPLPVAPAAEAAAPALGVPAPVAAALNNQLAAAGLTPAPEAAPAPAPVPAAAEPAPGPAAAAGAAPLPEAAPVPAPAPQQPAVAVAPTVELPTVAEALAPARSVSVPETETIVSPVSAAELKARTVPAAETALPAGAVGPVTVLPPSEGAAPPTTPPAALAAPAPEAAAPAAEQVAVPAAEAAQLRAQPAPRGAVARVSDGRHCNTAAMRHPAHSPARHAMQLRLLSSIHAACLPRLPQAPTVEQCTDRQPPGSFSCQQQVEVSGRCRTWLLLTATTFCAPKRMLRPRAASIFSNLQHLAAPCSILQHLIATAGME